MTYKGSFTDSWVRISVLVSKGRYFSLNTISVVLSLSQILHSQLYSNLCSGVSVIFTYWTMELNWIISVKLLCFLYHFIEVTSPQRAKGCPGTFWLWADVRGSVTSSIGAPVGETTYPTPPSMVLRLFIFRHPFMILCVIFCTIIMGEFLLCVNGNAHSVKCRRGILSHANS